MEPAERVTSRRLRLSILGGTEINLVTNIKSLNTYLRIKNYNFGKATQKCFINSIQELLFQYYDFFYQIN